MEEAHRRPGRHPGRIWRGLFVALIATIALALGLLLATDRPGDPVLYPPAPDEPPVPVFIVQNWLHADLAVPAEALRRRGGPAAEALSMMPQADWVMLGWGDAWHYRERGDTWYRRFDLLRSIVWPNNPAVIHMEPAEEAPTPRSTGEEVLRLELSPEGFDGLARRLNASFELHQGRPILAGRGRKPGSWFFHSVERSDLRFMCNNWIGELLNAAGVPVNQALATVTAGLAFDLRRRAGAEPVPGPRGEGRDPGQETPPVHSGVFKPLSPSAREVTGAIRFESFVVKFEEAPDYATTPITLQSAQADPPGASRSYAELMQVPADSLVAVRRVDRKLEPGAGICGEDLVTRMVFGFEVEDQRYDIALVALAEEEVCGTFRYRQR